MSRILIAYSTVDGQTRRICEHLQRSLEGQGHAVTLAEVDGTQGPEPEPFDKVVIGASIRYGKYRAAVYEYVRAHRPSLEARPSAFFSVNVVARKPGKDAPDGNPYVKQFLRKTPWRPALLGVFAGRIDYPRYGFLDRNVIRFIMWMTRGPTDPQACVEFTDWDSVDAFAGRVATL